MVNKKRFLSCALLAVFALNNMAFAADDNKIPSEDMEANISPIEIKNVSLEGCTGTYDDETGEYTFEQVGEIKSHRIEEEFSIDIGDINTETLCSDEMIFIESGRDGEIQNLNCESEIMTIENSLPDLIVYDLAATTDLIVGQEQNRFSYKVANLGSSIAQNVEVAFVVDDRVAGTYNLGNIGASQAVGGYFVLGKVSQAGTHGIGVYADYRNQVEESNETNNSLGKYFTWYAVSDYKPGLTVEITSPSQNEIMKGSKNSSDTKRFEFKISNIGPAATSEDGFVLAIYADGKKIGNMQVPQMNGMVEQLGRFNLGVNGYLPFTLKLVVDDSKEISETNEKNNSDEKEYTVSYCRHYATYVALENIPFPGDSIRVQLAPNAIFHCLNNTFYQLYAKKWNGITEQCNVTSVANDGTVADDTQIYICGGYRDSTSRGGTSMVRTPSKEGVYIKIELNDEILSTLTAEECGRTVMHELGHAFGMGHPPMNDSCGYLSMMQPHNADQNYVSNVITSHDKYGLVKQYEDRANLINTVDILEEPKVSEEIISYNITGDDQVINSEEALNERAQCIVRGEILPDSENVYLVYDNYTLTNFKVNEVYKGDGILPGDVIQIKEPYYTQTFNDGDEVIYRRNNYTDSVAGEEYIFFLRADKDDTYWPSCTSLSRYALNDQILITFPESTNPNYTEENYEVLRSEVLNKYN